MEPAYRALNQQLLLTFVSFLPVKKQVSLDELKDKFAVYNVGDIKYISSLSEDERTTAWALTCKKFNIDEPPSMVWRRLKAGKDLDHLIVSTPDSRL